MASKKVFNHEKHEKAWGGLPPTTHFLTTNHTKRHENFLGVVALTEGMAREFVIRPIGFSDGSNGSVGENNRPI